MALGTGISPELQPEVSVLLRGIDHHHFNIAEPKKDVSVVRTNMRKTKGEHVLFIESSTSTHQEAQKGELVTNKQGFVLPFLAHILKERESWDVVFWSDVYPLAYRLSNADLSEIVHNDLLSRKHFHHYFMEVELDALRERYRAVVEFEGHTPEAAKRVIELEDERKAVFDHQEELWHDGDFEGVSGLLLQENDLRRKPGALRDLDIGLQLETAVDRLREQKGGTLNVLIGATHIGPLLNRMNDFVSSGNTGVVISHNVGVFDEFPEFKAMAAISEGRDPKLDLMRHFILEYIAELVDRQAATNPSLLIGIASHYIEFRTALLHFVNKMSLDEARRLCESGEDALAFFIRQPAVSDLAKFLK